MVKQMFVKDGSQFMLIDLVIDGTDLEFWKSLMDYYPIWGEISKKGDRVASIEEYAEEFDFVVERDTWVVSKLLGKILYEDNPLVISDAFKKLCEYVPKNLREKQFIENIFRRFSFKMTNLCINKGNSFTNAVANRNFWNENDEFDLMLDEMIENEKECNPELSKKKEKKLKIEVKKSIPRKGNLL